MRILRYYIDWEFYEDGFRIWPISIGIVCDDGRVMYLEVDDDTLGAVLEKIPADHWVRENVIPHLVRSDAVKVSLFQMARLIEEFVRVNDEEHPEFWADYGSYDWVVLCQLYGDMTKLPQGWPMMVMDIEQLRIYKGIDRDKMPQQKDQAHNALNDALYVRELWWRLHYGDY